MQKKKRGRKARKQEKKERKRKRKSGDGEQRRMLFCYFSNVRKYLNQETLYLSQQKRAK